MTEEQSKEIRLDDVAKEAIAQDKDFLSAMEVGDSRAIILNDGVVVAFKKIREISKRKVEMEITCCPKSIRVEANLIDYKDSENDE